MALPVWEMPNEAVALVSIDEELYGIDIQPLMSSDVARSECTMFRSFIADLSLGTKSCFFLAGLILASLAALVWFLKANYSEVERGGV